MAEPFPFELPAAPEGIANPLSNPQTLDGITLEYLGTVLSYIDRLKHLILSADAWSHQDLLCKSHPDDPVFGRSSNRAAGTSTGLATTQDIQRLLHESLAPINTKLVTIGADVNSLQTNVKTLQTDVGTLKTKVGKVEADMGALTTKVDTVQADMGALKTKVGKVEADMGALTTKVDTVQADMGTLKTKVGKVEADMGTLTTKVDMVQTNMGTLKADVGTLKATVKQNGTSLGELQTTVTGLANTEEFGRAIAAAVSNNQSILEIQRTVAGHTETLDRVRVAQTSHSDTLARVQTRLQRVHRIQCQIFNASRRHNESLLPIPNTQGELPPATILKKLRNRDVLGTLTNLELFELLAFYGYEPPDPREFDPAASRRWKDQTRIPFLNALSDILTHPVTTFEHSLS
ncbi:hypothetical protein FRC11_001412 [Ceratobasidium sp. 423]|nr:hypothetical protein FRC11_001412 [Ceratobasidium sp. 423]